MKICKTLILYSFLSRRKGEDLTIDYQGLQRLAQEKMNDISALREECDHKEDVNLSIRHEISAKEREAVLLN